MARFPRFLVYLVPSLAAGAAVVYARSRPPRVEVVFPQRKIVIESIAASGRLRGRLETSVGAQTGGRVGFVPVREGDAVRAGQVVARMDDAVLQAQARQARVAVETARLQQAQADEAVATARAQLAQAARPPLASDIARLRADTRQAVAVADARLAAARQRLLAARKRLAELKRGPRDEEIDAARAQALQAQASLDQAQRDLERQRGLYAEGAVARSGVDLADTGYWVAKRTLESAQARLRQLQAGTRPEQIAQAEAEAQAAEAEVRASEATRDGARVSGDAQLRSLLAQPRAEEVEVARRRLEEAVRAREVARARRTEAAQAQAVAQGRLRDAFVTAPFDGTITQVVTEAGGVTGPNAPIVRLVRTGVPEIRIDLDEVNLGRVRVGQEALASSDAFPGQAFKARVREIGAQVDTDRGTVEVRLAPLAPPAWLRPGQTLSVNIIVDPGSERLVVPLTAVNTVGGVSSVLVAQKGRVAKRIIRSGPPGPDGVPVLEGLRESDPVVVQPAGLSVGQAVAAAQGTGSPE